jgi:hypothetical protein
MLEKKLQEELNRFREINKYVGKLIVEQDVPDPLQDTDEPPVPGGDQNPEGQLPTDPSLPDPTGDPAAGADPAAGGDPMAGADPMDGGSPDLGGDMGMGQDETEEIDITDLVNMTKSIKKDIDNHVSSQTDVVTKMDDVFTKLSDLENKLSAMDQLFQKIEMLDTKIESVKEPSPEERLEMRSLDSYPFNQNPQQFFAQKQGEMKRSGKNEYVLTKDDVENYSDTIKDTFNPDIEEDEFKF